MNAKTYLDYLSEVLGLQAVMMPAPVAGPEALNRPAYFYSSEGACPEGRGFHKCRLAIVNWVREPKDSLFEPEVADLFGKMLTAMKLPAADVWVLDCVMNERGLIPNELFKLCEPQCVLFFSREPSQLGEMQLRGPTRWLETFSPALLLSEAASKKIVWNDMQKIMRELSH